MGRNDQVKLFKEKYNKKHDKHISTEEAELLYFKRCQKIEASVCFGVSMITILIMACVYMFADPTETPLPYICGIAFAILFIVPAFTYKRKVNKYLSVRKKPERKMVLSKKLLADNPNSLSYAKSGSHSTIISCSLVIFFTILGIMYVNTAERWWAFGPALACLFYILISILCVADQRKKRKRINSGDFMLFSARLVDIVAEFGMEENSQNFGKFNYDMPLGESHDRHQPAPGYYSLVNVREDELIVGARYYLVLLKTKMVNGQGKSIYELHDMFLEDSFQLDDELSKLVIYRR